MTKVTASEEILAGLFSDGTRIILPDLSWVDVRSRVTGEAKLLGVEHDAERCRVTFEFEGAPDDVEVVLTLHQAQDMSG